MNESKTKKIIFVCTGNTCRSPMAEAVCRSELKRLRVEGVEVSSAGTSASKNGGINPNSAITLAENGLTLENFTSTQLTYELLDSAYAVVCMTEKQRLEIEEKRTLDFFMSGGKRSGWNENIHSFYSLVGYDVPDPYGMDISCYRIVFQKISEGMGTILEKLGVKKTEKAQEVAPAPSESPAPKKRGRPKKQATTDTVKPTPKKRGRPKKKVETKKEE